MKTAFANQRWNIPVSLWRRISWGAVARWLRLLLVACLMLVTFRYSAPPPGDLTTGAASFARDNLFNYVSWEVRAFASKLNADLLGLQSYMDEAARSDFVRAYMGDLGQLELINAQIADWLADPQSDTSDPAYAGLLAERDALQSALKPRKGMVENILQEQVSSVLVDEGLAVLGEVLPPVAIHITPLPDVLVLSPRDEIRVAASITLDGLTVDRRAALESAVDSALHVSSLVVDIGGMALYPAMVGETSALNWTIETTAHEWVHHYLFFFPLGVNYFDDGNPETRIINETTADVLGKEIAHRVYARYYPEFAAAEPAPAPEQPVPAATPDPDAFDFPAEMHETRVTVDTLLADEKVEEAEAYMEARRAFFHDNGFVVRKINQAYFAFYGGYQSEDNYGTAGDDPIGPAIAELREASPTLKEFLVAIRGITTRDGLLQAAAGLQTQHTP